MKALLILLFVYANIMAAGQEGDKATSFSLPNLYHLDKKVSLDRYKGRVVLLNLWASWCSGCQEEMPLFVKLQEEFHGKGFSIVLSSIDKEAKNALHFLHDVDPYKQLNALYDSDKKLPKAYRCIGMPSSYLIDKSGKIVKVYVGSIDKEHMNGLKTEIKSLLRR